LKSSSATLGKNLNSVHQIPGRAALAGESQLGSLGVDGPRPLFEVFHEELSSLLVQLRFLAGGLSGFQGAALIELLAVTLDRGAIDSEVAGGLGLGDALVHRLYDLLSEVY
jgi:hypothetical protein